VIALDYWTTAKGIGGRIKTPEDFVVREVIGRKFLRRYTISEKIGKPKKYDLLLIRKRNITTNDAIRKLAGYFGIPDIGYAGLKDKFSVSFQYLTVKSSNIGEIDLGDVSIIEVRKTDKFLSRGDLIGNEFEITLHRCKSSPEKVIKELEKNGVPNFFGPQRFGKYGDNHVLGRSLLKREKKIKNTKDVLKFYVHAYQSWLFNLALDEYMGKNKKPYFKEVRIPGYKTPLGNDKIELTMKMLLKKDKIKIADFMINELRMSVIGAKRAAFIKVKVKYEQQKDKIKLYFTLPKGSYATTVIREITKGNLRK